MLQQKDNNAITQIFIDSNLYNEKDIELFQTFCVIISTILKHTLIEDFLPRIIAMFQKEVLTFNIATKVTTYDVCTNKGSIVIVNDNDVNRVFGYSLKKH